MEDGSGRLMAEKWKIDGWKLKIDLLRFNLRIGSDYHVKIRGAVGGSADPILGSACCMLDEIGKAPIVALHIAKDHLEYRSRKVLRDYLLRDYLLFLAVKNYSLTMYNKCIDLFPWLCTPGG